MTRAGASRDTRRIGDSTSIEDIAVPHDGVWTLRVALRDAAGNFDADRAGTLELLRFDSQPPSGEFLPVRRSRSGSGPPHRGRRRVRRRARRDRGSGARATTRGARCRSTAPASRIPLCSTTRGCRRAATTFGRALTDRAGNERTVTALRGGTPLQSGLPVRAASALAVGKSSRVRVKSARGAAPALPASARQATARAVRRGDPRLEGTADGRRREPARGRARRGLRARRPRRDGTGGTSRRSGPRARGSSCSARCRGPPACFGSPIRARRRRSRAARKSSCGSGPASRIRPDRRRLRNGEVVIVSREAARRSGAGGREAAGAAGTDGARLANLRDSARACRGRRAGASATASPERRPARDTRSASSCRPSRAIRTLRGTPRRSSVLVNP